MAKIILDIKDSHRDTFIKMINSIILDKNCDIHLFQTESKIEHQKTIHIELSNTIDPCIPFLIGYQYSHILNSQK